ncbi:MAG TPA: type IV pilus twitching motility protein PilT [bacterium]|nr:type IV pilus twitching motility protein PilT [bacterium]
MPAVDRWLQALLAQKGSDLHFSAGRPAMMRVHGELVPIAGGDMPPEQVRGLIDEVVPASTPNRGVEGADLDFAYELPGKARFRVNAFQQSRGPGAVFRIIPSRVPTLDELKMPPQLTKLSRLRRGLVLVTGPTGSGKSTTLAAMIDLINKEREGHILTIEDPIEFVHENQRALVTQREIGRDAPTFASALRAAIRQDPDIVLVGEMRDYETVSLALTAAETGALVFGTLHTNSASKTVDRLIDVFPEEEQEMARMLLAGCLKGIVSQQLLRTADGAGRVAALEIAFGTFGVSNLIREGRTFQLGSVLQAGKADGMQCLEQALSDLFNQKKITAEAAWNAALNKEYMGSLIPAPANA